MVHQDERRGVRGFFARFSFFFFFFHAGQYNPAIFQDLFLFFIKYLPRGYIRINLRRNVLAPTTGDDTAVSTRRFFFSSGQRTAPVGRTFDRFFSHRRKQRFTAQNDFNSKCGNYCCVFVKF